MEARGNAHGIVGEAGGFQPLGAGIDLFGEIGDGAKESPLLIGIIGIALGLLCIKGNAHLLHGAQDTANSCMGILHIIEGVFIILPERQIQIEIHGAIAMVHIEEEPSGIGGDLIQKIGEGDALAGTLTHAERLSILHQPHQLHQNKLQLFGILTDSAHSCFKAQGMAMVIGAEYIDAAIKFPLLEFIAMVGNIHRIIGIESIGLYKDFILLATKLGSLKPFGILFFIDPASIHQKLDRFGHIAALMEGRFQEPMIEMDLIFCKIRLHPRDIAIKAEADELLGELLFGLLSAIGIGGKVIGGEHLDIIPMIAILGEFAGILPINLLHQAGIERKAEEGHLIARIIHIEFLMDIRSRPGERIGQAIAHNTAAGIAHMHGTGGIGGNKFYHDPLSVQEVGFTIIRPESCRRFCNGFKIALPQIEIQKAGACDLHLFDHGMGRDMLCQHLADLLGRILQNANIFHGKISGIIAVLHISRLLHIKRHQLRLRQQPFRNASLIAFLHQLQDDLLHIVYRIFHFSSISSILIVISFSLRICSSIISR